jgi:DNA topoisomerase-1
MENKLDDISGGRIDWKTVLQDFWKDFSAAVDDTKDLRVSEVLRALDDELGPHFFPDDGSGRDPRLCPTCNSGRLSLKLGKFGAFIGCSNYPECRCTRPLSLAANGEGSAAEEALEGPKPLGIDPESKLPVILRKGPYGHYVQLGESDDKQTKPKRVSLYKGLDAPAVTLEIALRLLALPRSLGKHPETAEEICAGVGRFGPYLKHGTIYKSLAVGDDVLEIGMNRAVELLAGAKGKTRTPGKTLGDHPDDGKPVTLNSGRFGPYVSHGGIHATLPRGRDELSLDEAVALLAAKAAKMGKPSGKTTKRKTPTKAKPAAAAKAKPVEAAKAKPVAKAKPAARAKAKPAAAAKTAAPKAAKSKASPRPKAKVAE